MIELHAEESLERTNEDIRIIVEASYQLNDKREQYCRILTKRANGTFLWVALAISRQKNGKIDQEKVVCGDSAYLNKLLPVGLDAMYNRMLSNIVQSV